MIQLQICQGSWHFLQNQGIENKKETKELNRKKEISEFLYGHRMSDILPDILFTKFGTL